jgi:hypothetical protein
MKNYKFNNFTKILIYKEYYQWIAMYPDYKNVFLGYDNDSKHVYILNGSHKLSGILQKKYSINLMDEFLKEYLA